MGAMKKLLTFILRRILELALIILAISFLPRLPPNANFTQEYRMAPTKSFTGALSLNGKLNDIEIWHQGDLYGPEAFADYNGELYTSVHGGDIVKLVGNHMSPIVKIGRPCQHFHEERICGRPLGMQFDKTGALFVADPYHGIFKINVKTGEKQLIISTQKEINGKRPLVPNSLALASNGDIYWSDSSTQFGLEDGIFDMLADGSGRLIHYNIKTKVNTVLIDNLQFANGVVISDDESFVVVSETGRNRIHRYYLTGPKHGTHDIFVDGLPGMPDNLKPDGKGGFIVPLILAVDPQHPQIFQVFGEFPLTRRFFARFLGIIEYVFKLGNRVYKNIVCDRVVHFIGHFSASKVLSPDRTSILRLNRDGEIIDSIHTFNKNTKGFAEAHIFKNYLYLGSPLNDYIGRIPLSKIGWEGLGHTVEKRAAPEVTVKPTTTTTTPKPATTTTPKPTTTTTPKPATTTTTKPTTTTPKPTTTTTPKPTTTTTTTPRPTTSRPTTTTPPKPQATKPVPTKAAPTVKPAPSQVPKAQKVKNEL